MTDFDICMLIFLVAVRTQGKACSSICQTEPGGSPNRLDGGYGAQILIGLCQQGFPVPGQFNFDIPQERDTG